MSQTPNTAIAVIGIELVPHRGPRCARCHRAAAKVVAWPSGSAARQYTAPDRHGSLRRRTSPEPQTRIAWSRCQVDAGQICPPLSSEAIDMSQRCQELTWQAQSIRTLPNHVNYVANRRTNSQRQLFSRNRDKALLVRAIPVWKGTAFDVNCDAAICLAYRICSEVSYRAVGVSLFSPGVPCHRALLAYLPRSDRITVMMYCPPHQRRRCPSGWSHNA
jgi:hypothetical protein